jgi:HK97 family phage portal protein
MSVASRLRGLNDRLNGYAMAGLKAGVGYPNPGWAPYPGYAGPSSSGVMVTDEKARTVAAWYAAIRVISEDIAGLPLVLYRRNGRAKDRADDHPLYRILHDAPNPEMTSFVFRETLQAHLLSWGNGYAEKELDRVGRTVALWPLRPDRMDPRWEDDQRVYYYTVKTGTTPIRLTADRVFHIPGLGFDGLVGYSPLRMARETLGSAIALREYGNRVLASDARPSVVLKHPKELSDKARANLRTSWEASHGGFTNAGRMALLEEGMDISTVGFPPEDIQFIASQEWQVTEVARWMRLAPHKIADLTHATFSNIEEQGIDHVNSTLRAWCTRWEQQLGKDVIGDPALFAEHLLDAFMRGKTLERYQAFALAIANKAMTPNEWRAFENMNPQPWGDEPVLTPNNSAPTPPPPPGGPA